MYIGSCMIARGREKKGLGKILLAGAKSIAAGRKEGATGVCVCGFRFACTFGVARARARPLTRISCVLIRRNVPNSRARARYFEMVNGFRDSEQRNAPRRGAARSTPWRLG